MDISVNKPAKDYLKRQFEQWYSEQVTNQLEGRDLSNLEAAELQPIDLGMPIMKEIGAKWLVDMANYISNNPQSIVNGFVHSGITRAADGMQSDEQHNSDGEQHNSDGEQHNTDGEKHDSNGELDNSDDGSDYPSEEETMD